MAIIVKGKDYTPAPEGLWDAVCVDVEDKGFVDTQWGLKAKLRIVWEIGAAMDDGRPFTIGKTYTASLHEKSTLYKDLKAWRGRAFTPEELRSFDVEKVLGAPCRLVIVHTEKDGEIYGNVSTVMKVEPTTRLRASGGYVRKKDRPDAEKANSKYPHAQDAEPTDDGSEIPF